MKTKFVLFLVLFLAVIVSIKGHHAFAAEFDVNKEVKLEGTMTKIEWFNPHIWIYLDVKENGSLVKWQCEGGAPNSLTRNGWTRDALKSGDVITIDGYLAKDGSKTCNARSIMLPGGKRVFAGSSAPEATNTK